MREIFLYEDTNSELFLSICHVIILGLFLFLLLALPRKWPPGS